MSTTIIRKLVQSGQALTGRIYQAMAGTGDINSQAVPLLARNSDNALIVTMADLDKDAFGRIQVASPYNVFDVTHVHDKQPLLMDEALSTGTMSSTHLPNEGSVRLRINSGTATGQSIVRQSFMYAPYQPGRSQLVLLTGNFTAAVTNSIKELGLFDSNNGLFFRQAGDGTISVVRRTFVTGSAVDTAVAQSSWNMDTMNGAGPSAVTLDFTKSQLFVIDYGWLGVGIVRFGFVVGNRIRWVHKLSNENTFTGPYMSTGALPVRYSIRTTGTLGANADLQHICSSVTAMGGFDREPFPASTNTRLLTGGNTAISGGTRRLMMTLRLRTGYVRGLIMPLAVHGLADSLDNFSIELVLGGTRSGGSATTTQVTDAVEVLTGQTTLTGGRTLASAIVPGNGSLSEPVRTRLPVAATIAGTAQEVSVVITAFSTGTFYAGASWGEIY